MISKAHYVFVFIALLESRRVGPGVGDARDPAARVVPALVHERVST